MKPNNITFFFAAETLSKVKSFIHFDLFIGALKIETYKKEIVDSLLKTKIPKFETEVDNPLLINLTLTTAQAYTFVFPKVMNFDDQTMKLFFKNTEALPTGAKISF
jgi:hypothetical protein